MIKPHEIFKSEKISEQIPISFIDFHMRSASHIQKPPIQNIDNIFVLERLGFETKSFEPFGFKRVNLEDNFNISCQTNDPSANVTLLHKLKPTSEGVSVLLRPTGHIKQIDQHFQFSKVKLSDAGIYVCAAENDKEAIRLSKGRLMVRPGIEYTFSIRSKIIYFSYRQGNMHNHFRKFSHFLQKWLIFEPKTKNHKKPPL